MTGSIYLEKIIQEREFIRRKSVPSCFINTCQLEFGKMKANRERSVAKQENYILIAH